MNIMTVLKKIKKTNDTIEAEYYPENMDKKGFMKIDCLTGEVIEHISASHISALHVKKELKKLMNGDNVPKEKTLLWY